MGRSVQGLLDPTGGLLISDGWNSTQSRPILNALLSTPAGSLFLRSVDTSGDSKDAQYIADFMISCINEVGPQFVVAICMDGACVSSFPIIMAEIPHVFCFICPTHSVDNFLKNVCGSQQEIVVRSVRTSEDEKSFEWGSTVFSEPMEQAWEVIKFATHHCKPLSIFRALAKSPETWEGTSQPTALELVKFCETRFASRILMLTRYRQLRPVLELLVVNPGFKAWVAKQKRATRDQADEVRELVQNTEHWKAVELADRVLAPVLMVLRLTDGKTGATLGKVYHLMSTVSALFENPIEGLSDTVREKMHALFMARWTYFHEPVFTAAYFLDPEFIRGSGDDAEEAEFREVMSVMCQAAHCPHTLPEMMAEWAALQTAISVESHGMSAEEAFSVTAQGMPAFEWARTYLIYWPCIKYAACRLPSLACSASACEHSWSIEGWVHSKKRNRLGQSFVECLVRTHTNLLLESKLDLWLAKVMPWEIEMVILEPEEEAE